MVIFGGATGDTGKYIITGDTYALDLISSKWSKLEGKYFIAAADDASFCQTLAADSLKRLFTSV